MSKEQQKQERRYLMETGDGFAVSVPESRLEAWQRAQAGRHAPLNKAEQQLRDRIVERLYTGKR